MKKCIALFLAIGLILMACPLAVSAEAPDTSDASPVYTMQDMHFANNKILGKVVHDESTPTVRKLYARVTVFFVGGTYAVFSDFVEDGEINIEIHGIVLAVSVELTGTKHIGLGNPVVAYDSWGEYYRQ
ncbi:MAG: hypothetical protein IKP32_07530 [Clostridia bacterium]|nr:hypothetical protein [Clostridia bacterium]